MYFKAFLVEDILAIYNNSIKEPLKELTLVPDPTANAIVALITSSKLNNGVAGYIADDSYNTKILKNKLTIGTKSGDGSVFFQGIDFVSSPGARAIVVLDPKLELELLADKNAYRYLALALSKVYINKFHGFVRGVNKGNDFSREYIILPVQENGDIYTKYMGYLYVKAMIAQQDKKILDYNKLIDTAK